ncbi:MAG: 50S ribosomal protein L15P [Methanosaeta sp. PtaB.Bin039]|nr:MAG: 50S ribosomal protein L15P [Methanosaeta sp. PtaB.Bin039]HOT07494.1 uL15 family ribosomal protein [Methanotrichaceae archaeon]HQF16981.1 uL15 family ribosomal protein [Methanotrichaceae archaeon]HQI91601.1 uL15 family ribosomal protein [Methanotrichaceae archaeon]HQJ28905.1 uL15 family ribosomal protein [Methanotrichaceae archaeon]
MVKEHTKKGRGHRTYHGKHKNQRGGGSRGGRGNAGNCKHHWVRSIMRGDQMGSHGFTIHGCREELDTVNVGMLDQMVSPEGKVELNGVKVLGRGRVTRRLAVSASAFSGSAKSKIEAAGGEVVVL